MVYIIVLILVLLLIGLFLYRGGFGSTASHRRNSLKARSEEPSEYRVEIAEHGRYGDIRYSESGRNAVFGWEFGGTVLVVIGIPSESLWIKEMEFPVSRRKEIAERVAREVIRQKAPGRSFLWRENMIHIS